jgi:ubiquinone/menaquinone biosynthesis C-methylase UbiE
MNPVPEPCKSERKGVNLHYDEQWQRYSEEDVFKRVNNLSPVLDAIISHLTVEPGSRILDLGCGPGILPLRICASFGEGIGFRLYGIDISQQALQLGKKVVGSKGFKDNICLVKGDCEELPFQNNCYDGVVSNATINLLLDKKNGFEEIARVTKKEGTVVVGDCTTRSNNRCIQESDDQLWSACISGAPTEMEFRELAKGAGLEIVNVLDLTDQVTRLIKKGLWDWPEFIQYEMDYHIFVMKKG